MVWILGLSTGCFLVACYLACRHARLQFAHPLNMYLVWHSITFVWRPWAIFLLGEQGQFETMRIAPQPSDWVYSLLLANVGLFAFLLGCCRGLRRRPLPMREQPIGGAWDFGRLFAASLPFVALGGYSLVTYVMTPFTRGEQYLSDVSAKASSGAYVFVGSTGYVVHANLFLASVLLVWLVAARRNWQRWVVAGMLGLWLLLRAFHAQGRWSFVLMVLALICVHLLLGGRRWPRTVHLIVLASVFLASLPLADRSLLRRIWRHEQAPVEAVDMLRDRARTIRDLPQFETLMCVRRIIEASSSYSWGRQYLYAVLLPIPRVLWRGKPTSTWALPSSSYNLYGCPWTIIGDFYITGGWLGVVVGCGLIGYLLGRMHRRCEPLARCDGSAVVHALLLAILPLYFRDGGTLILVPALFMVFPAWFLARTAFRFQCRPFPGGPRNGLFPPRQLRNWRGRRTRPVPGRCAGDGGALPLGLSLSPLARRPALGVTQHA